MTPTPRRVTGPPAPAGFRGVPRVLVVLVVVLVLALGGALWYGWTIQRSVTGNLTRGVELPADTPAAGQSARPTKEPQETGTLNYLLLGTDSRDPANAADGRSDTIMLVHLNAARDQAHIISFPRDMYVTIPGYGQNKINAAYSLGGPPLTVRTMEDLTGARMDHVVLVDFDGFVDLTTDLGGVTVTNDHAFSSHGYTYPEGRISIAGEEALWFVRERYALPEGDLDRAENQRKVIKAIVQKGLSAEVVADPTRFTAFLSSVAKHLTADTSLSDAEIRATALSLRLTGADIQLMQAPIAGYDLVGDESINVVDTARLDELNRALKADRLDEYVQKYPEG